MTLLDDNTAFELNVSSQDGSTVLFVQIQTDDGTIIVFSGNTASAGRYQAAIGAISAGAKKVVIYVNPSGVPTLSINGVNIPLVFQDNEDASGYPNNSAVMILFPRANRPASYSVQKLFIATGNKSADDLCCD